MLQNDPVHKSIPPYGTTPPPIADNRFSPTLLSHTARAVLRRALERNQLRRRTYHGGPVRIHIDGEAHELLTLEGGVSQSFRVPLGAAVMEIFGDDCAGDLLLGVILFPAPALGEDDQPQHLSVILEGGQTITIEIVVGCGIGAAVREQVIQLSYADAAEVDTERTATPAAEMLPVVLRPAPVTPENQGGGVIQPYPPGQ